MVRSEKRGPCLIFKFELLVWTHREEITKPHTYILYVATLTVQGKLPNTDQYRDSSLEIHTLCDYERVTLNTRYGTGKTDQYGYI